jgi:hypothetical protein
MLYNGTSKKDWKFNFIMEASNFPIFCVANIINKNAIIIWKIFQKNRK